MKKLIIIASVITLMLPLNGCKILKHKTLNKTIEKIDIQNDIRLIQDKSDSIATLDKYKYDKSNTTVKETISYKTAVDDEPIELTAVFKIDTARSKKGDTALTLVGGGVSLTITRNPLNNTLTANIKSGGKTKKVPFNELLINRTITNNKNITDTSKFKTLVKKLTTDSADKSKKKESVLTKKADKTKETTPTILTMGIILGVTAIIGFFVWLYFKNK